MRTTEFRWDALAIAVLWIVAIVMMCGCGTVSRAIVGTQDTRVPKEVLVHNETMAGKGIAFYTTALTKVGDKEDKADNKTIIKLANLVDDELRRAIRAGEESKIAMMGNTAVRIMAQPEIQKKVEEGFQFGMNALTMAISGGVGGTGVIGTLLARSRKRINKEVLKNRIKTKVLNTSPELLAKVNEAAEHTEVAGIIT